MLAIGLMSGTSADGVDAAIVELNGEALASRARGEGGREAGDLVRVIGFHELPFPRELRTEILELGRAGAGRVDSICRMDAVLGEWFAAAALEACERFNVPIEEIDLIGSHGQTIHHLPEAVHRHGYATRSTLQIGDAGVIAERTGATTVSDFRSRDMAAGGQGAPLVPMVDYLLYRSLERSRAVLNIGGIANVTFLPAACGPGDVVAFDTGPGNALMDGLVSRVTAGVEHFDRDGQMAAKGAIHEDLLARLLSHPYFAAPPPKSTGPETFGMPMAEEMLAHRGAATDPDLVHTAAALTASTISRAIAEQSRAAEVDVFASGGGVRNPLLMQMIGDSLAESGSGARLVSRSDGEKEGDALGIAPEAKEAVAFAVLAALTIRGVPGTLPRGTGASKPVVLGCITPGRRTRILVDLQKGLS